MTEHWLLTPPLPGEHLVERSVALAGVPVRVAVHEELLGELDHLVPLLEAAASNVDAVVDGTELSLPWGDVRVVERDGSLVASMQDSRTVLRIARSRCFDVSQAVWTHRAWRTVRAMAGLSDDLASVGVNQFDTFVLVSRDLWVESSAVEVRHAGEEMVRWFVGEQPFDEKIVTHLAASTKFAGDIFGKRPWIVPAFAVPAGYRVFIDSASGITEIRDDSDAVVFSA